MYPAGTKNHVKTNPKSSKEYQKSFAPAISPVQLRPKPESGGSNPFPK